MQIIIKGKQMEVQPRLRQHIERKVQRLSRLVGPNARIEVTVLEEQTRSARDRYTVQLALSNSSHPIRSEVSAVNANMALDLVLDKVTAQLGRHKDRQTSSRRHRIPPVKVLSLSRSGSLSSIEAEDVEESEQLTPPITEERITEERNEEIWFKIMEIRRIHARPMNDQEVIAEMEAHSLSFYPFFNQETNSVNVMYRLDGGGYGLLVPTLEQVTE
jgi:putative sigma-54 modulation protein